MKFSHFFTLFFALLTFVSCDFKTTDKALAYYEEIVTKRMNQLVSNYEVALIDSFENYNPEEMQSAFEALEKKVLEFEKDFNGMKDYYGDASLIDNANELISAYKKALPLYAKKISIESLPDSEYTDEKAEQSTALMDEINELLNPLNDKFIESTEVFAAANGFELY